MIKRSLATLQKSSFVIPVVGFFFHFMDTVTQSCGGLVSETLMGLPGKNRPSIKLESTALRQSGKSSDLELAGRLTTSTNENIHRSMAKQKLHGKENMFNVE